MTGLSAVEQRLLRLVGEDLIAAVVRPSNTDRFAWTRQSIMGGGLDHDGRRGWYQVTSKGIGWAATMTHQSTPPSGFEVFVSWTRAWEHLAPFSVNADRRAAYSAHIRRRVEHQIGCLSYPGSWAGVPWRVPVNEQGMTYDDVHEWWLTVHLPEWQEIRAGRSAILDELLPATAPEPEAVDLLDLLALQTPVG